MELDTSKIFSRNSEIIATFLTRRYYNDLYVVARQSYTKEANSTSLTATYARTVSMYMHDIELVQKARSSFVDILRDTINALHSYYCQYVADNMPLNSFIEHIVAQVVPSDYRDSLKRAQKDAILRELVAQSALDIGKRALQPDMLKYIIDDRTNQTGIEILRETGIKVISDYRSSLISKLFAPASTGPTRMVAAETYDKLRTKLIDTTRECAQLTTDNQELRTKLNQIGARVQSEFDKIRAQLTEAITARDKLVVDDNTIRAELAAAQTKIRDYEARLARATEEANVRVDEVRGQLSAELAVVRNQLKEHASPMRMIDEEIEDDADDAGGDGNTEDVARILARRVKENRQK